MLNYLMRKIQQWLCLSLVLCALVSCVNLAVPPGTVVDVMNDKSNCDCLVTYIYDSERQAIWTDCPCTTNIGDTLIKQ